MAELDSIEVYNPTDEDFTVRFNGEPYTLASHARREWAQYLALHVAKHLSDYILNKEVAIMVKKKTDNPHQPEVGQLVLHDNPKRRIALYDILGSKEHVELCINSFPFKGFIGEMSIYDSHVEKARSKRAESRPEEK